MQYLNIEIDDNLQEYFDNCKNALDFVHEQTPAVLNCIHSIDVRPTKTKKHSATSSWYRGRQFSVTVWDTTVAMLDDEPIILAEFEGLLVHEIMHAAKLIYAAFNFPMRFGFLNLSSEGLVHLVNSSVYTKNNALIEDEQSVYANGPVGTLTHNDADEIVAQAFQCLYFLKNAPDSAWAMNCNKDFVYALTNKFIKASASTKSNMIAYCRMNKVYLQSRVARHLFKDSYYLFLVPLVIALVVFMIKEMI